MIYMGGESKAAQDKTSKDLLVRIIDNYTDALNRISLEGSGSEHEYTEKLDYIRTHTADTILLHFDPVPLSQSCIVTDCYIRAQYVFNGNNLCKYHCKKETTKL